MYRVFAMGCGLCVVALLAGTGHSGDPKKEQKDQPPKKQIQLPSGWAKIGLSDEQKKKIRATRATFSAKIEDLRQQIEKLKKDEMVELVKFLTESQKEALRKAAAAKLPDGEKKPDADKK
ncbi:MAG TPA: hypothetical protein VEL76_27900 [Gemmataceae bacterium]|nr:hypothetical protein [Gemmataceae bacterium]